METPYTERYDRLAYGFDPEAKLPISAPGFPTLRGGYVFVNKEGYGRRMGMTDKNNFGPRFGFAYIVLTPKTVVRGGYGIFFSSAVVNQTGTERRARRRHSARSPRTWGPANSDSHSIPGVNLEQSVSLRRRQTDREQSWG